MITGLVLLLLTACGGDDSNKPAIFAEDNVALAGYDPVAYFTLGKATVGNAAIQAVYQDVTYHFSSEEHRALFEAQPEKFVPAYGGWCAYAVAENAFKMEPDPTNWQIQDEKLLLFYEDFWTELQGGLKSEWNAAPQEFEQRATANWVDMTSE